MKSALEIASDCIIKRCRSEQNFQIRLTFDLQVRTALNGQKVLSKKSIATLNFSKLGSNSLLAISSTSCQLVPIPLLWSNLGTCGVERGGELVVAT